jgi:hypothetical protein
MIDSERVPIARMRMVKYWPMTSQERGDSQSADTFEQGAPPAITL